MTRPLANTYGMACPKCRSSNQIDVAAVVWVRLCRDGTDVFEAANGDQEWTKTSAAYCAGCGQTGTVASFTKAGGRCK